jgi:hypothetical protein
MRGTAVARSFFDIPDGKSHLDEDDGAEHATLDEVRAHAMAVLPDMGRDDAPKGNDRVTSIVLVSGKRHRPVSSATPSRVRLWLQRWSCPLRLLSRYAQDATPPLAVVDRWPEAYKSEDISGLAAERLIQERFHRQVELVCNLLQGSCVTIQWELEVEHAHQPLGANPDQRPFFLYTLAAARLQHSGLARALPDRSRMWTCVAAGLIGTDVFGPPSFAICLARRSLAPRRLQISRRRRCLRHRRCRRSNANRARADPHYRPLQNSTNRVRRCCLS